MLLWVNSRSLAVYELWYWVPQDKKFRMNESNSLPVRPPSSSFVRDAHSCLSRLEKVHIEYLFYFIFLNAMDINILPTSHLVYLSRHTVGGMFS